MWGQAKAQVGGERVMIEPGTTSELVTKETVSWAQLVSQLIFIPSAFKVLVDFLAFLLFWGGLFLLFFDSW